MRICLLKHFPRIAAQYAFLWLSPTDAIASESPNKLDWLLAAIRSGNIGRIKPILFLPDLQFDQTALMKAVDFIPDSLSAGSWDKDVLVSLGPFRKFSQKLTALVF
jgi:hypothetical protein